ncbi:MAG: lipocalin-like domain-containing protein [Chloroflexota bacterium]
MNSFVKISLSLILVAGAIAGWRFFLPDDTVTAEGSLISMLSEVADENYARATEPNNIQFPRDLGPHEDYQVEWWYYTGILESDNGHIFGYQLTFFRSSLTPPDEAEFDNRWRTNQAYQVHFTITDVANDQFYPHERVSRGTVGLAGAQADPYRVWLENWFAEEQPDGTVRLYAESDAVMLDITLTETRPPVLHGDRGLSVKGEGFGNASYYYSLIHQQSEGTVRVGEEQFAVNGLSWKDHEYSTSALDPGATGWDWFSIHLDDGSALMFFEIREENGRINPFSSGSLIAPDGSVTRLSPEDWTVTITDEWESPRSNSVYPVGWEISIPTFDIDISGQAFVNDQELNVTTTYWEGAVEWQGTKDGDEINGRGYIEMTGR